MNTDFKLMKFITIDSYNARAATDEFNSGVEWALKCLEIMDSDAGEKLRLKINTYLSIPDRESYIPSIDEMLELKDKV